MTSRPSLYLLCVCVFKAPRSRSRSRSALVTPRESRSRLTVRRAAFRCREDRHVALARAGGGLLEVDQHACKPARVRKLHYRGAAARPRGAGRSRRAARDAQRVARPVRAAARAGYRAAPGEEQEGKSQGACSPPSPPQRLPLRRAQSGDNEKGMLLFAIAMVRFRTLCLVLHDECLG